MSKSNIVLIGMPGVGKSSIGVVLAKVLGMGFVDTDIVIQQKTGKPLRRLISELGADGFKELENGILLSIEEENCVIATGGSAVFGKEAMERFRDNGIIIYLEIDCASLAARLGDLDERGVVHADGQGLEDILAERGPLYEKYADITVREKAPIFRIDETVNTVIAALSEKKLDKSYFV